MPRKAKILSARAVASIKVPGRHAVGGVDGLHLRVLNTGSASWVLRIVVNGKRTDIGLGPYPLISLARARDDAYDMRRRIRDGFDPATRESAIDPVTQGSVTNAIMTAGLTREKTFAACAEEYIKSKSPEWRNRKHHQQWTNTLTTYAFPAIGDLYVSQIGLSHVLAAIEPIWLTKTETASRVRGRIESVLNWAKVHGYRTGENPARWKGHLDAILPSKKKVRKPVHHEAVEIAAMPIFWKRLATRKGMAAPALQFLILTAARSGEVRHATWDEINVSEKIWTIPEERMKAMRMHRVPLQPLAMEILERVPRYSNSPYIFPAPQGGPLSDMALTEVMRRMGESAVPHGFRSTFRDWVGDYTEYHRDLAEHALAHTLADETEAAYRRRDALERRRRMMLDWESFVTSAQNSK